MFRLRSLSSDQLADRQRLLQQLARRGVANEHDADEVVQETWLAALREPEPRVRNLDAWLTQVVRYQAARARKRALRRDLHERAAADVVLAANDVLPNQHLAADVDQYTLRLPEPYRSVVRLRYLDGLSPEEIAAQLGRSLNTVKCQLRRAHDLLRRELGDGGKPRWLQALVGLVAFWRSSRGKLALTGSLGLAAVVLSPLRGVRQPAAEPSLFVGSAVPASVLAPGTMAQGHTEPAHLRFATGLASHEPAGLPRRVALRGQVVAMGQPQADAAILLSAPDRLDASTEVARSDAQGAFTVASVDARSWVSARPALGTASWWVQIAPLVDADGLAVVRLQVMPSQPELQGRVLDAQGVPIAGADLAVFANIAAKMFWRRLDTWEARPEPARSRSGSDGSFRAEGAMSRRDLLLVTAPRHAPWLAPLGTVRDGVVRLAPALDVQGEVVHSNGLPAAGVKVVVEQRWPLPPLTVHTAADGRFVLDGVGAGRVVVRATEPGGLSAVASAELDAVAPTRLALVLNHHATVRGIAHDEQGKPLSGFVVTLLTAGALSTHGVLPELGERDVRTTITDAGGGFAFAACDNVDHVVWLTPPGQADAAPLAWQTEVRSGGTLVDLVSGAHSEPTSSVTGTLPDAPLPAVVLARSTKYGYVATVELAASRSFVFPALPPAEYELLAMVPRREPVRIHRLVTQGRQHLDVGRLAIPARGSLAVVVTATDGELPADLRVILRSDTRRLNLSPRAPAPGKAVTATSPELETGTYSLRVLADGYGEAYHEIDVVGGQHTMVPITLQRGVTVRLRLAMPKDLTPGNSLTLTCKASQSGETVVYDKIWPRDRDESGAYVVTLALPAGDWSVEVRGAGLRGQASVRADNSQQATYVVLRTD